MNESLSLKRHLIDVARLADMKGKDFLIIGGLCVTLYGVERLTRDIDLLIPGHDSFDWRLLLEEHGYRFIHGTNAFQQFEGIAANLPPLDLMLADDNTWEKLKSVARSVELDDGVSAAVPDPLHYIAMKLKALTSPHRRADNSDWSDILNVTRLFDLDFHGKTETGIVLRYGSEAQLEKLRAESDQHP